MLWSIKEAQKRGEKIGRELEAGRINKLHAILLKEKRYADLERSTHDKDFPKQLMLQYGILLSDNLQADLLLIDEAKGVA